MEYISGRFGILDMDTMEDPPLILLDGGIELRRAERYEYQNSRRQDFGGYLFQYTLNGEGCFEKNRQFFPLTKNMGFLACMPEESRYWLEQQGGYWEFLYLHFDGPAAASFLTKLHKICPGPFWLEPDGHAMRMALKLLNKLIRGERLQKYEGGEFLYRFLCALLREVERPNGTEQSSLVNSLIELMEEEYSQLTGLEELANRLGVSPAHLTRTFHQKTGMPPIQYLTGLRIQAAMNDLLNTDNNLETIAENNGFGSGNYFCKVFRRHMGKSPTQYRREHRVYRGK